MTGTISGLSWGGQFIQEIDRFLFEFLAEMGISHGHVNIFVTKNPLDLLEACLSIKNNAPGNRISNV